VQPKLLELLNIVVLLCFAPFKGFRARVASKYADTPHRMPATLCLAALFKTLPTPDIHFKLRAYQQQQHCSTCYVLAICSQTNLDLFIHHRPLSEKALKIDINEWLRIGSTFHSRYAIAAEASPLRLPQQQELLYVLIYLVMWTCQYFTVLIIDLCCTGGLRPSKASPEMLI
jgi:hypothetical protein